MKQCIGCFNIKEVHFPINNDLDDGKNYLDTEQSWIDPNTDEVECFVEILFCPVCGKKL